MGSEDKGVLSNEWVQVVLSWEGSNAPMHLMDIKMRQWKSGNPHLIIPVVLTVNKSIIFETSFVGNVIKPKPRGNK